MVSLLPRPGQVEQHHDTLGLQHPVRQEAPAGAEGRRPDVVGAPEVIRRLLAACEGRDFASRRDTAIIMLLVDTGIRAPSAVRTSVFAGRSRLSGVK